MALIEWDESFSVGNDEIDSQHKHWIQLINNLDMALIGQGDPEVLKRVKDESLEAMIDYARFHFHSEEQFMEKINYPKLKPHQASHSRMACDLLDIQKDIERGYKPLNTQLMSIMMDWLKNHILTDDKQYGIFAEGHRRAGTRAPSRKP
jgi:hemerythrin